MDDNLQGAPGLDPAGAIRAPRVFIAPNVPTELTIRCVGGPVAMLQAAVFDVNGRMLQAVGFLGNGSALSTGNTGSATWAFSTNDARRGYVKWRVTGVSSAAGLQTMDVTIDIIQQRQVVWSLTETRQIPEGMGLDVVENSADIS
jgi:hypothetical protein